MRFSGAGMRTSSKHLGGGVPGVFFRDFFVQAENLGDLPADAVHRVERGHGFLENHADLAAADFAACRESLARTRSGL